MATKKAPAERVTKKDLEKTLRRRFQGDLGDVKLAWQIREFEQPERTIVWYVIAGIITLALLIYSVVDNNFLFGVMIVVIAFIITIQSLRKPDILTVAITTRGVVVQDKFYHFDELNSFWIVYEPPDTKELGITFLSNLRPELTLPLERTNPLHVRKHLAEFIPEEEREESVSTLLSRLFKI